MDADSFTYDDNGNRTKFVQPGLCPGRIPRVTRTKNRTKIVQVAVQVTQVTRNVRGHAYTLEYDIENRTKIVQVTRTKTVQAGRLVGVSGAASATFVYDGDGNRVRGTVGGVTTTYIGNPSLTLGTGYLEWTGSTSTMKRYYYAGSTRVAMRTGSSTLNYLLGDHLGSQAITTDSNGQNPAEIRYYPWGTERYTSGTTPTSYHFTGQRLESYINLYWYGARWYDAQLGRWIQPDQIVPDSQGVQGLDRYAYVNNSPVVYTDPSGNMISECGQYDEECGASLAQINYETQRYYYENCSSGYGGGCPDYKEAIAFTAVGLLTAGAAGPAIDAAGGAVAETITTVTTAACADGDCTNEVRTGTNVVYRLVENGATKYVGMTNDILRRTGEQLSKVGRISVIPGLENLSRTDARSVEQALIEFYGLDSLMNKINSIAVSNPIYQSAIQRGNDILRMIGFIK